MKKNKKDVKDQEEKQKISFVNALRSNGYLFPRSDSDMENLDKIAKESNIPIPESLLDDSFLFKSKGEDNKTKICATKTTYEALQILKKAGGQLPGSEVIRKIEDSNVVKLTDWEKNKDEKTGKIRWQSILVGYASGLVKAGFLLKESGMWKLTKKGDTATKLSPEQLFEKTSLAFNKWFEESKKGKV